MGSLDLRAFLKIKTKKATLQVQCPKVQIVAADGLWRHTCSELVPSVCIPAFDSSTTSSLWTFFGLVWSLPGVCGRIRCSQSISDELNSPHLFLTSSYPCCKFFLVLVGILSYLGDHILRIRYRYILLLY
ncbi:hypothetical protein BDV59DRAFT_61521 [Aspergillus ambiguus]|uniref:uncharacterized protein n=1 Tax=Aspergillus ambiguus TaxID=176160 RepID=UPI003CCCE44B